MVRLDEVRDPADHAAGRETVAGGPAGVVLEINHAGERDAIFGPAAAVGEEVIRLRGAGAGSGVGEVVAAADEAGLGGACVMGAEAGIGVCGAFSGLGGGC